MTIAVSEAAMVDLDDLVPLFDAYRKFYRQDSDEAGAYAFLRERLSQQDTLLLLARDMQKRAVGFMHLFPSFSSVRMVRLWILNDIFVMPHARNRRVGRTLMDAARERARVEGVAVLALATESDNAAAKALYTSLGYVLDVAFDHYELMVS